MLFVKVLVAIVGTCGVVLAGSLSHPASHARSQSAPAQRIEFGGVSAQTATRAGSVDRGAVWYTLQADGLHSELKTR